MISSFYWFILLPFVTFVNDLFQLLKIWKWPLLAIWVLFMHASLLTGLYLPQVATLFLTVAYKFEFPHLLSSMLQGKLSKVDFRASRAEVLFFGLAGYKVNTALFYEPSKCTPAC